MPNFAEFSFHIGSLSSEVYNSSFKSEQKTKITYDFHNHFHQFVGDLISELNRKSLTGMMDVNFHTNLVKDFFAGAYQPSTKDPSIEVKFEPAIIDVGANGAYAGYNWELLFHVPLTVAVHLSKQQRFAEAQRWFHFVFDPTSTDTHIPAPQRFWKFLAFRQKSDVEQIGELMKALAEAGLDGTKNNETVKTFLTQIEGWRNKPFQPHVIARTRFVAYQYQVVMKYIDNLIAWGDSLFRQDTIETINEATQMYVLAANILGPKPQELPRRSKTKPQTFRSLRKNVDEFGNAMVENEGMFPYNLFEAGMAKPDADKINTLLGIGQSIYFCIPKNEKLMGYWDLVADRLFKIRHCMNIGGMVRQLPLFEPPIDPGMLVRAAAAGIDLSSVVNGLNPPPSPVRAMLLIQKALEICAEVRNLGGSLLAAIEKKDGEHLARLRQQQDIEIQTMVRDARFLQWKETEANTDGLLRSRETVYQRYRHYQRLLGVAESEFAKQATLETKRQGMLNGETTEEVESNFKHLYDGLLADYSAEIALAPYPPFDQGVDIVNQALAGLPGNPQISGNLHLNKNENKELNTLMPLANTMQNLAMVNDIITSALYYIPNFKVKLSYWGIGGDSEIAGGQFLGNAGKMVSDYLRMNAGIATQSATSASKTAFYQRRTEDWTLQSNLAAKELRHIGQQIIASLIREKITEKEYRNQIRQIEISEEINTFIRDKFTNDELYVWMQSEISKVYYDCYKFAFDVARQAEQTMKRELMRPELDQRNFLKFNYWDSGRKGLLSGETLHLDIKRMEMAYFEHHKREYELVKHVSLRQLDPVALLRLKTTGVCEVKMPEWLFDMDCPGHYMRRIKTVAMSIPCITGPYTSINCMLSLQKSTIRKSPLLRDGEYARDIENEDDRFLDYYGTIQSIVTSSGQNDSGLFEVNLNDERPLPFEGSGVESAWRLELPNALRQFDYNTITDVILHIRYTSRQAGDQIKTEAQKSILSMIAEANTSGLARLFSLRHDFPTEWHRFTTTDGSNFLATIKKEHFPYFVQGFMLDNLKFQIFTATQNVLKSVPITEAEIVNDAGPVENKEKIRHTLDKLNEEDRNGKIEIRRNILPKEADILLMIRYTAG